MHPVEKPAALAAIYRNFRDAEPGGVSGIS
jgi:hypothetical protein